MFKIFLTSGYSLTFDVLLKFDKEAQEILEDSLANYRRLQAQRSIEVSRTIKYMGYGHIFLMLSYVYLMPIAYLRISSNQQHQ